MKDFEIKNVYTKESFELYSKLRDKSFRYVKFNGNNYDFLCNYIHEISPNTTIWEENKLKVGGYYTFSGKTYQFMEVPLWEIRCCIASNPYIVINGERISLALSQVDAEEYIKSSINNRITFYDNISTDNNDPSRVNILTTDYLYIGADKDPYLVINKDHTKGLGCSELGRHDEWFIIGDDRLHTQGNTCIPIIEPETHTIHFEYDLRDKADRIMQLMYEINEMSYFQQNRIVFNPSWQDYSRYRILYTKCKSEAYLKDFIQTLYNFIFEETKGYSTNGTTQKKTRVSLPQKFRYYKFVEEVGEYRNYFDHGFSEYESNKDFSMADIFLNYTNTNFPPSCLNEFLKMQLGFLNGFISFLEEVKNHFANKRTIKGHIDIDNRGNVFLTDVLLPKELKDYKGCECEISCVINNNLSPLNYIYEYYCQFPDHIIKRTNGIIELDSNNNIVCDQIWLDESFRPYLGMKIQIEKIMLTSKTIRDKGFLVTAKEGKILIIPPIIGHITIMNGIPYLSQYELPKEWLSSFGCKVELTHISFTWEYNMNIELIIAIKEGVIEQDSNNNYHCGDVLIPDFLGQKYHKQIVKLGETTPNKNPQTPYSYYCSDIFQEEGIIEQDRNNHYHCGDVLIPRIIGQKYLNKLVKLRELKPNINTRSSYKFFCNDVIVVNSES